MNRSEIRELQTRLNALGYQAGNTDGLWGARTKFALDNALLDLRDFLSGEEHAEHISELKMAWGKKVSPRFKALVADIARELHLDAVNGPNWLMACMAFETAKTFSPSVKNPTGSAVGLIQFLNTTAASLETSTAELASMTAEDQLDKYVRKYFKPYAGRLKTLADVYMAILWPAAVGRSDEHVMWRRDIQNSRAYTQNRYLDDNQDGVVVKREAAAPVYACLREGLTERYFG